MSLNTWLSHKIYEASASDDLFKTMWKEDLKDHSFTDLTADEKKWLSDFVKTDPAFKAYSASEQEDCLSLVFQIEKTVPIISDSGTAMPAFHRLYIAFEIAKPLVRRSKAVLDILSSVVVYSGAKIRKNFTEGGLLISKGLNAYHSRFSALTQSLNTIGSYTSWNQMVVGPDLKKLMNELNYWQKNFKLLAEDKKRKQFVAFLKTSSEKLQKSFIPKFEKFSNEIHDKETKKLFLSISPFITETFDFFIKAQEEPFGENQVSIHFSWISHLTFLTTNQGNLIVHELAHALDFEYSGLDGIPSTDLVDNHSIANDWNTFFEEALENKDSKYKFLNPYGLTNSYEFFAVCSEHFFREPLVVKKNTPELFIALEKVYGANQGNVKKWSLWKFFKISSLSKLNASFR